MNEVGLFGEVIRDMESGIYNFCDNGKCIGCGQCCSDLLPLSKGEIKDIKRYIAKKNIKPTIRKNVVSVNPTIDLTCPFLDDDKECDKCKIYSVRPAICRAFKCDTPPSKVRANRNAFWKNRKGCSMREVFFGEEKDNDI